MLMLYAIAVIMLTSLKLPTVRSLINRHPGDDVFTIVYQTIRIRFNQTSYDSFLRCFTDVTTNSCQTYTSPFIFFPWLPESYGTHADVTQKHTAHDTTTSETKSCYLELLKSTFYAYYYYIILTCNASACEVGGKNFVIGLPVDSNNPSTNVDIGICSDRNFPNWTDPFVSISTSTISPTVSDVTSLWTSILTYHSSEYSATPTHTNHTVTSDISAIDHTVTPTYLTDHTVTPDISVISTYHTVTSDISATVRTVTPTYTDHTVTPDISATDHTVKSTDHTNHTVTLDISLTFHTVTPSHHTDHTVTSDISAIDQTVTPSHHTDHAVTSDISVTDHTVTTTGNGSPSKSTDVVYIIIGVIIAVVVATVTLILVCYLSRQRRRQSSINDNEALENRA